MSPEIYKKIIKTCWILALVILVMVPVTVLAVKYDFLGLFGGMPSYKSLENPEAENDLSSELYAADGKLLGKYYRYNRTQATYEDLSPQLVQTLLCTEDIRFHKHAGIDLKGLLRAVKGKLTFSFAGGGSTVTMQLAENLYNTMSENEGLLYNIGFLRPIIIKVKEWIIAVELERSFTKKEILAMYFNTIFFGHNSYGISTASKVFFNKEPDSLNYQESALLIGMLNKPTAYSPIMHPEAAKNKRTEVLYNLHKYGHLTREAYDSLKTSPLGVRYQVQDHIQGPAPYFRQAIRPTLLRWADEHGYDLFESGLKIYTTIDSRLQQYAEEAVKEHMQELQELFNAQWEGQKPWRDEDGNVLENYVEQAIERTDYYRSLVKEYGRSSDSIDILLNKPKPMTVFSWEGEKDTVMSTIDSLKYYKHFLQAGFMAMDPHSGQIRAWVGGINFKYFQYDHVYQGKRQPGSTFKPVVYTAAIDQGYSPCYKVPDSPVTFNIPGQEPYTPQNYNRDFTGEEMTIRQGMAQSKNSITSFLMKRIGPENVVNYARMLGIESPLEAVPSLALGVSDVSIYELVGAYATFVNQGVYTKPYFITRIEDKYGNVIQEFPAETKEALSEETAYIMLHMLRGATEERNGTALGLSPEVRHENEVGAKTGTTQNASDGWFVGLTRDLVAGVWVGGDDRSIHFRSSYYGQGAKTAMPIWDLFMQKVYADEELGYEKGAFPRPTRPLSVEINCEVYENPDFEMASEDSVRNINQKDKLDVNEIF